VRFTHGLEIDDNLHHDFTTLTGIRDEAEWVASELS